MLLLAAGPALAQYDCTVTVRLDDAVSVGSLQYDIDYSATGGDFNGSGGSVDCTDQTGSVATFFDDDAGGVNAAYLTFVGFTGPTNLAICTMTAPAVPSTSDFVVTVTDGSDPFTNPLSPLPAASVSNVGCTGGGLTTTTTTTTTSTTSSTVPLNAFCWIRVSMTSSEAIGSLQYELGYDSALGEFEGSGGDVNCQNLVFGSLATMADNEASEHVGVAVISLMGFTGPTDLARCGWLPYGPDPVAGDFTLTVVDASDTAANPVVPAPTIAVTDILCWDGASTTTTSTSTTSTTLAPYCGDGATDAGEECDDGFANSDTTPDACRTDCTLPVCGDDVVDAAEQCDDGAGNSDTAPDACRSDCSTAWCGDGVLDGSEDCDLGSLNDAAGSAGCYDDCTEVMICGDANGDMLVTASDAQQVLQAGVGLPAECPVERCDASQDGNVTAGDAQRVLSGAVGLLALDCTQEP